MIQIHIATDDQNQGYKSLAAAICSSFDSLGMVTTAEELTEEEVTKLIPMLDDYLPALRGKLGNCVIIPGLPEAPVGDPDAIQPEEPQDSEFSAEAPSEDQIALENAVKRAQDEKKEIEAHLLMATAFDVATDPGEDRILPGYRVERVRGLDDTMGWIIKNAGGWLYSQKHDKMMPGQKPSEDTVIANLARALEVGRLVYRRDLKKKDGLA